MPTEPSQTARAQFVASGSPALIVEELPPERHAQWDAYVDAHPDATVYHLRAWQQIAERVYRLRAPLLVAREGSLGPVRGVLPLVVVRSPIRGGYATTGLFGSYGRVLADSEDAGRALLQAARRVAREERVDYLIVKSLDEEPLASGSLRRDLSVVSRLRLEPDAALMWKGFRDKIRNMIRKAQKSGLEVRSGLDGLASFYDVLAENLHDKGMPPYGLRMMQELLEATGPRAEVLTLWHGGRAVCGAVLIYFNGAVNVVFASSRPSSLSLSPNNLLYWEIIQRGCQRGMKTLEFGRSAKGSGQLTFKLGWGAQSMPQPLYLYTLRGKPPKLDPGHPGVRCLMGLWKRLPRRASDTLGPTIWRYYLAGIG